MLLVLIGTNFFNQIRQPLPPGNKNMHLHTLTHTLVLTVLLVTLGPLPPTTNDQETGDFYCCDA